MSDAGKTRVVLPADVDILLGRGKPFQNHPGNQRMLGLVDKYRERYQRAERKEKHDIVEEVMTIISNSGGRFLRRVDYENYWVEVSHAIAYRKVGHAFRSKARKHDSSKRLSNPPMSTNRVEAPSALNKTSVEEVLLADLRMRRAALHQAELMNVSNLASFAGSSPLDRLLFNQTMGLNSGLNPGLNQTMGLNPGLNPGLYNGLGAAGLMGGAPGLGGPGGLGGGLLAANSAFLGGNGVGNGLGNNGFGNNGLGNNGMGANGLSANGLGGVNGLNANGLGVNGLGGVNAPGNNAMGSNGLGNNGLGTNGLGNNGMRANGLGNNDMSANGLGNNGMAANGIGNGVGSVGNGVANAVGNNVGNNNIESGMSLPNDLSSQPVPGPTSSVKLEVDAATSSTDQPQPQQIPAGFVA